MTRVRVAEGGEADAMRRVIEAAFGAPTVARLVDRLLVSDWYLPGLTLVADDGGDVVGMVMLTRATVRHNDDATTDVLNLSPLAVHPSRQREGVGRQLVETAIRAAAERGETLVVLEGDPALYRRLGFEPAAPTVSRPRRLPCRITRFRCTH